MKEAGHSSLGINRVNYRSETSIQGMLDGSKMKWVPVLLGRCPRIIYRGKEGTVAGTSM